MADDKLVLVEGGHAWTLDELRKDLAPQGLYVVTAAERAVLEACAEAVIDVEALHEQLTGVSALRIVEAELARREAAK